MPTTTYDAFPAYCLLGYTTVVFLVACWACVAGPADAFAAAPDVFLPPAAAPDVAPAVDFDAHYAYHPIPDVYRGRRSATKAAFEAAYAEDAAALKETVARVETHLATAAAALGDAFAALTASPAPSAVAGVGADVVAATAADAVAAAKDTVERVRTHVRDAAAPASARARTKAIAASALGGFGLLVGVPYVPGITDNLLLGVLGAATGASFFNGGDGPTVDAETGPPIATERL